MIPPRLAAFASRIGLTGLAIAILVALLAVQTVRLEGFKVWPLSIEGARPKAERLQRDLDNVKAAQAFALEQAQAAKLRAELRYMNLAERIELDAQEDRKSALADAERYIAGNRVRCQAAGSAGSGAPSAAGDHGAALGDGAGATAKLDGPGGDLPHPDMVAVLAQDVRICTDNTVRLEAARAWALELEGD